MEIKGFLKAYRNYREFCATFHEHVLKHILKCVNLSSKQVLGSEGEIVNGIKGTI